MNEKESIIVIKKLPGGKVNFSVDGDWSAQEIVCSVIQGTKECMMEYFTDRTPPKAIRDVMLAAVIAAWDDVDDEEEDDDEGEVLD